MLPVALVLGLWVGAAPAPAPTRQASPLLTREALRARTPPAGAWGSAAFDPREYFAPDALRDATRHAQAQRRVHLVGLGSDLAWYLLFLFTPLAPWLRRRSEGWATALVGWAPFRWSPLARLAGVPRRVFGLDWAGAWLFAWLYFALGVAVSLPLALWQEALSQRAGLSTYSATSWSLDVVKASLLQLMLFSCLVFGLYGLIRRLPRRWWLALALPAALVMVGYGLLEPHLPRLYYEVVDLEDSPRVHAGLAPRLRRLADLQGVRVTRIRVLKASRTTRRLGAYLVGLGEQRELVLYDTLLAAATPGEIEAAVAHELGHEGERNDALTYGAAVLALGGLLWGLAWILRWGGRRRGLRGPGDVATLPVLGCALWLTFQALGPLVAWRSREAERQADRQGLVLTGDPEAAIRLHVRLARRNRAELDPPRWVQVLWASHPSPRERIARARWYAAWLRARGRR